MPRVYSSALYFLFMTLVLGTFASMAQNDYGRIIIGITCLGFSGLFILRAAIQITKSKSIGPIFEFVLLAIISLIFSFRAFFIRFPFIELVFVLSAGLLLVYYVYRLRNAYREVAGNKVLRLTVLLFYGCLLLFLLSMLARPLEARLSEIIGGLGFGMLILVVILGYLKKQVIIDGQSVPVVGLLRDQNDQSTLLFITFAMMSLYMGFTTIGLAPSIYFGNVPAQYIKLVNQAEAGADEKRDGKYQHEIYKAQLDRFLDRHGDSDQ